MERLDKIARYLKDLRDAGVPVIWRPYHEMNGGWFWWGKKGERFKELWIQMYERFTSHHNLNNLLWFWCPNAVVGNAGGLDEHYPGHEYVDILGCDIYVDKGYDWEQRFHDDLLTLGEGRPIAMGEVGYLPDPSFLKENQPKWTLFLLWTGYQQMKGNNPTRNTYIFNHEFAITQDELPAWIFDLSYTGTLRNNQSSYTTLSSPASSLRVLNLQGRFIHPGGFANTIFVGNFGNTTRPMIRIVPYNGRKKTDTE
jgi:hypothetical protein